MRSNAIMLSALLLISLGHARAAAAQSEPETQPTEPAPNTSATDNAEAHRVRARKLFAAQRYEDARSAFRAAWEIEKDPNVAAELGVCEMTLGSFREAAELFSYALRTNKTPPA